MAIFLTLSSKADKKTGLSEVLIRLKVNRRYDIRGKSKVFVTSDNFKDGQIKVAVLAILKNLLRRISTMVYCFTLQAKR